MLGFLGLPVPLSHFQWLGFDRSRLSPKTVLKTLVLSAGAVA